MKKGEFGLAPDSPGYCTGLNRCDYAGRSQAFRTLRDCKFNPLPFVERLVSVGLDGGVVNEHIVPAFTGYKPVALRRVEPLNSSCFSQCFLLLFI
jgi:hypothetical protein